MLVVNYVPAIRIGNNQLQTIRRTRWPCQTSWSVVSSAKVAPRSLRFVKSPVPWSESATARKGRVAPRIVQSPLLEIRTLCHWHNISSVWGEYHDSRSLDVTSICPPCWKENNDSRGTLDHFNEFIKWNSYWMQFGLNLRLVYIVLSQVSLIDDIVKQTLNTYEYLYVYTHY